MVKNNMHSENSGVNLLVINGRLKLQENIINTAHQPLEPQHLKHWLAKTVCLQYMEIKTGTKGTRGERMLGRFKLSMNLISSLKQIYPVSEWFSHQLKLPYTSKAVHNHIEKQMTDL